MTGGVLNLDKDRAPCGPGALGGEITMATITVRNGVNVDQLVATIGAIQADPAVGAFTFKARSTWEDGGRNQGEIRDFVHAGSTSDRGTTFRLVGDEPPVLLGSNAGPNAVELVLQALAFCYARGLRLQRGGPRASRSASFATRSRATSTCGPSSGSRGPGRASPRSGRRAG